MSYTKVENLTINRLVEAMDHAVPAEVSPATRALLLQHGTAVAFDGTAERAWVSSIVQDKPDTQAIDVFTIGFALDGDTVLFRPSGFPAVIAHWHAADPAIVAAHGIDFIRREQMLLTLGEVDGVLETDDESTAALKRRIADARNIRKLASSIAQLLSPPAEVL